MLPLEMDIHKMAEHMMGRNICFLLLTQQVDLESTETTSNKSWAQFLFVGFHCLEKAMILHGICNKGKLHMEMCNSFKIGK